MIKISTGQDSNLRTYLGIAKVFGKKAEDFIQKKIDESPNGEDEEVMAHESQMMMIFASML